MNLWIRSSTLEVYDWKENDVIIMKIRFGKGYDEVIFASACLVQTKLLRLSAVRLKNKRR